MKRLFFICSISILSLSSCTKDDTDGYVALEIVTTADVISVNQGNEMTVAIFENDLNVLASATVSIGSVEIGSVTLDDNGTPDTILDDKVRYLASDEDFIGNFEMTYEVCNDSQNCEVGVISVSVLQSTQINIAQDFTPYNTLSTYNFFIGELAGLTPNERIIPYAPTSILFSDYAHKKRFVYLPEGTMAKYDGDAEPLDFPVGAVIIKNFYYENVLPDNTTFIIETRLMFKTETGWTFAEYFWNDEQTEAFLDVEEDGGFREISWLLDGQERSINYRMPSTSECFTCHKSNTENAPIGVKPQSLNSDFNYVSGSINQLEQWQNLGILERNLPESIVSVVDYNDTSQPLDLRVRSYFDVNCASCHSDEGHCDYRVMRFAFDESQFLENLGVCIDPDDEFFELSEDQKIIKPGDPENSIIYARLNTNQTNRRMPLLGRRSIHTEGVQLVEDWINSLEDCEEQ